MTEKKIKTISYLPPNWKPWFSPSAAILYDYISSPKGEIEIPPLGESFRPFFSPTQERACPSRHKRRYEKFILLSHHFEIVHRLTYIEPRDYRVVFGIQKEDAF